MTFEWDENKNSENIAKHKVSFEKAQDAFFDVNRIIFRGCKTFRFRKALFLHWKNRRRNFDSAFYNARSKYTNFRRRILASRKETL